MSSGKPTRDQADLAEVLELVLDKGIVINADIAVTVGETELLGIELRAAIASFETAAKYGLAFPSGTDMRRVERASGREPLEGDDEEPIDLGIDASSGGSREGDGDDESDDAGSGGRAPAAPSQRPTPQVPTDDDGDGGEGSDVDDADGESEDSVPDEAETEDGDGADADTGTESDEGSENDREDA